MSLRVIVENYISGQIEVEKTDTLSKYLIRKIEEQSDFTESVSEIFDIIELFRIEANIVEMILTKRFSKKIKYSGNLE